MKIPTEVFDAALDALEAGVCNVGMCIACGEIHYGIEPDARGYECESCGKTKVYGCEEILLMGA